MEITLIRHGESVANNAGRWQGQGDSPLSPRGRQQAKALAERIARTGVEIDHIVSSDLSRAAETADAIARELGITVERDRTFREIDVGRWEGLTVEETFAQFPEEVLALRAGEPVKVGGGESWPDLHDRVDAAFARVRANATPGSHVVVVAHGGVISALVAGVLELRDRRPRPLGRIVNTAMTTFRIEGRVVELVRLNDASHADDQGPPRSIEGASAAIALSGIFDPDERFGPHLRTWAASTRRLHCDAELRAVADQVARETGRELGELESLAAAYEGLAAQEGLTGVMMRPETIRSYVLRALHDAPLPHVRLAAPANASVTHILATKHGPLLADYNVLPRSHPDY